MKLLLIQFIDDENYEAVASPQSNLDNSGISKGLCACLGKLIVLLSEDNDDGL